MKKTPWTPSRIVSLVLLVLSVGVLLLGLQWMIGGTQLIHKPPTSGEDVGPLFGFGLQLAGTALVIIGGVLVMLFTWLYLSVTRRLKLTK